MKTYKNTKISSNTFFYPITESLVALPRIYASQCNKVAQQDPIFPQYHPSLVKNNVNDLDLKKNKPTLLFQFNDMPILRNFIPIKRSKSLSCANYTRPTKNFLYYQKKTKQNKQKCCRIVKQSQNKMQSEFTIPKKNLNCQQVNRNSKIMKLNEKKSLKKFKNSGSSKTYRIQDIKSRGSDQNKSKSKRKLSRGSLKSLQNAKNLNNLKGINLAKSMSLKSLKSIKSTEYMSNSSGAINSGKNGQEIVGSQCKMMQIYQRCRQTIEAYQLKVRTLERENLSLRTQNNLIKSAQ